MGNKSRRCNDLLHGSTFQSSPNCQNRNTSLVSVFEYELCAVPFSIIDEFGFIRKCDKANIAKKLAIISTQPCPPDEVIVDG